MRRTHYRTCPLCEATCGLAIETEGDRVVSIRGDADDVFSQGYICPKATALADLHEDPDRLRTPMRRHGSRWEPLAWDDAFDLVSHRLKLIQKAYGKDAIAAYQGNPTAHNLGLLTFGQIFLRRLGTRNLYSATSADQLPHMLSSLTMFGHQVLFPIPDVDRTQYMLILGANPLVSNGSVMTAPGIKKRLEGIRARGGKVVVLDPRRTETASMADEHVFLRPGTDALFLLGLLNVLYAEGLADAAHLAAHVNDDRTVRRLASEYPPERVAGPTGIAADTVRRIARDFAGAPSAVCYGRLGTCTQEFGGITSWLINLVNILTGNLDRAGGAMFTTPAVDLVKPTARLGLQGGFARWRSRVSELPEFGDELPVAALAEEIETPGQGQIRALITSAGNPVLSTPNGARLERALPGLDFMVSVDPYINETSRHAQVILPPTSHLEHDHYDLAFYAVAVRNIANYSPAVFERGADQRHDWEIFLELASRMETSERPWGRAVGRVLRGVGARIGPRRIVDAGLRMGPYKGLSLKKLEATPHGIDLGPLRPQLPDGLWTANHEIELAPQIYVDDVRRLSARFFGAGANGANGLVLIGRRHLRSNNSWMHNSQRLVKGKDRCTLLMHPDDAAARGLGNGDRAAISSRVGSVEAAVTISDEIMPGVVSLPHGWGHHRDGTTQQIASEHAGVSANDLTDERFHDGLTATAGLNGMPVEVAAARAEAG
ncbi:MAG TPA: molybdopterin-dependent oxidoreductase [Kofleriaceae bacterium]|nr:molybdopterin-dependent oxidoreductase [Kofleriaceae bacterium]